MTESSRTTADPKAGTETQSTQPDPEPPSSDTGAGAERRPLLRRMFAIMRPRNGSNLREDLTDALAASGEHTAFSAEERAMLHNILRLREVRIEDIMVPRADIEAVEVSTSLAELLTVFEESGHSRMPIYAETLDDPRGMIHIRDVVAHITKLAQLKKPRTRSRAKAKPQDTAKQKPAAAAALDLKNVDLAKPVGELNLIRPVLFTPPSTLASDLMARMKAARIQMALVIDEYGGTDGLVSLEDIVEMVVGDIEDEHDEDEPLITKVDDGIFVVDARVEIEEVAELIGSAFVVGDHGEDVDTIGGLIFNAIGRVPARAEVVQAIPGFEFHILDADPRRIKRVRIVQTRTADRRRRAAAAGGPAE